MLKAVFGSSEDPETPELPKKPSPPPGSEKLPRLTLPDNVVPITPDLFDRAFGV